MLDIQFIKFKVWMRHSGENIDMSCEHASSVPVCSLPNSSHNALGGGSPSLLGPASQTSRKFTRQVCVHLDSASLSVRAMERARASNVKHKLTQTPSTLSKSPDCLDWLSHKWMAPSWCWSPCGATIHTSLGCPGNGFLNLSPTC